jgi:mono/diheme cytochrome c family protein/uncharacterized membrane protein
MHLLASSIWIGGVITLVVALVYGTRGVRGEKRREVFAIAIPKFTTVAIISVIILAATGFYSAWLQVGNLVALRETSYGQVLIVKLLLIVPILALGALNQRIIGPRLRTSARSGVRFGQAIAAEAMLGVGILLAVGLLTMLPTARETLSSRAERTTFHFDQGGTHVVLYISPGAAGANQYAADVGLANGLPPDDMQVLLRFTKSGNAQGIEGVREVDLARANGPRFEASGAELSVVGDWTVELILREPGQNDVRFTRPIDVPKDPPSEVVPGPPPYFSNMTAGFAVLFTGLAVMVIVLSLRAADNAEDRLTGTGIGIALLIAAALIFALTRANPTPTALASNPVTSSPESIASGRDLFVANCSTCHGQDARGDGQQAPTLNPRPADLTAAHVDAHTDGDLYWWIAHGISPAMPGFNDTLSDQQIWDVINYVRSLRADVR